MYKKNDELTLTISDLSVDGQGIGKIDGAVFFCRGLLPGETAKVKIIKIAKRYYVAKALQIITKSKARITPPCPVFKQCGGCTLQHLSYLAQLTFKQTRLQSALSHIGGIDVLVDECISAPEPYGYRNKAVFPVAIKDGEAVVGFYAKNSHYVVPTETCAIQHPAINKVLALTKAWLNRFNITIYNETTYAGLVRSIYARITSTNQLMAGLIVTSHHIPHLEDLIESLKDISELKSVMLNINDKKGNALLGATSMCLWGKDTIKHSIDGIDFDVSLNAFLQVNTEQTQKLYEQVLAYASISSDSTVVDLYCGIGSIALLAAERAKQVYGIEHMNQATDNAIENAKNNGIENAEFICGDCTIEFDKLAKRIKKIDVLIADPPRKGLDAKLIDVILQTKPERMVYVSCDPASLARDLKLLNQNYDILKVTPFDMFAQTTHMETCVLLKLKS